MKEMKLIVPFVGVALILAALRLTSTSEENPQRGVASQTVPNNLPAKNQSSKKMAALKKKLLKNVKPQTLQKISQTKKTSFSLESYRETLHRVKSCYDNENCRYDKSDPKSYEFAIGKDLARRIERLKGYIQRTQLEDDQVSQIGREFLEVSDGYVKEAALDLISSQPPSVQNRDSILDNVVKSYDEKLIPQALMELNKYPDAHSQMVIAGAIGETLSQGSFRVKQKLAEHSSALINSHTYENYKEVAKNLPPDSPVKSYLDSALNEYRMKNMGG